MSAGSTAAGPAGGGAGGGVGGVAGATTNGGAGAGGMSGTAGAGGMTVAPGCGIAAAQTGSFEIEIMSGGVMRKMTLTIPKSYDPKKPYRLVVGYHGNGYDGARMRKYLRLDTVGDASDSLFVYPWGGMVNGYIGWQLGEYGGPFGGGDDLVFFDDMLKYIAEHYCLDAARVFVTGQSWGGDMTHFISCFRGDRVRAGVAVAANGDYYLPPVKGECLGHPEMYTLHGVDDGSIPFDPQGLECRAFWEREHDCDDGAAKAIEPDQCEELPGCSTRTVWCPYGPDNGGHQVPDWYPATTMKWFRSY